MKKQILSFTIALLGLALGGHAQIIYSENFESCSVPSLPSGWSNVVTGLGLGWQTASGTTAIVSGIVIPAHTKYALVNDGGHPANYPAKSTTPTFSLAGTSHVYLSYDAWFNGYHLTSTGRREQAWIELSTDGGSTYSALDTVTASGSWISHTVAISSSSSNCKLRFVYTDNRTTSSDTIAIAGVGLDNIKIFEALPNDIAITAVSPIAGDPLTDYAVVGGNITFGGTAYNNGYNTISSFTATYLVPGTSTTSTTTVSASIAPFTSHTFTCTTPYTISTVGSQAAQVYLTLSGDTAHSNDTLNTIVNGVSFMPAKRLLFEDATGTWCGWNVRSIVYMDSLWSVDSNSVSLVEIHDASSDPMAMENTLTQHYDSYMAGFIGGYPTVRVDRHIIDDPSNNFPIYAALHNSFGFANMAITPTYASGSLSVSCTVNPALNLSGDYRLELILTEDNVRGTASGYAQHNYYNTGTLGAMGGTRYGYDFVTLPTVISASLMHYDFVGRYTVPDMSSSPNGVAGSLPSSMTGGSTYSYSFSSISIPTSWSAPNLHAVVLLIDNNSTSSTYGQVLNSATMVLSVAPTISGVSTLCVGASATFSTTGSGGSWSSSSSSVATVSSTGVVTGVSAGTAVITYTSSAGTATATITINPMPNAGTITGPTSLCPSATTTYTSSGSTGGTWSSTNPGVATILGSGFAAAISVGTTVISYTVTNSCGTAAATLNLTVSSTASAGTIVGTGSVCVSTSTLYTDATTGGSWSSSNTSVASVGASTGMVYGISAGSATITYSVTLSCGTARATQPVTVTSGPYAGTLSGASTVCEGATTTLTPSIAGGTWTTSSTAVASVNAGIVTGVSGGSATITYTVNNGCGAASVTQAMTVNPLPSPGTITGADSICVGDTVTLHNTVTGGAWTSSSTAIASVNGTTGKVKGLSAGSTTISYGVTNSCGTTYATHYLSVSNTGICHTAVADLIKNDAGMLVYPNPTGEAFTVELPLVKSKATITITDIYGKTIQVKNIENKNGLKEQIDLSNVAKGTYFVTVAADGTFYREKVIIW